MKKMNNKGMVLSETIRIVLAIMGIILLLYLSFSLFQLFIAKTASQQAKEHMENIERIIDGLEEAGSGSEKYILLSPKGWSLTGFQSPLMDQIPQSCNLNKCVCMCHFADNLLEQVLEGKFLELTSGDLADSCDEIGFCLDVEQKFLSVKPITEDLPYYPIIIKKHLIDSSSALEISLENNKLTITTT